MHHYIIIMYKSSTYDIANSMAVYNNICTLPSLYIIVSMSYAVCSMFLNASLYYVLVFCSQHLGHPPLCVWVCTMCIKLASTLWMNCLLGEYCLINEQFWEREPIIKKESRTTPNHPFFSFFYDKRARWGKSLPPYANVYRAMQIKEATQYVESYNFYWLFWYLNISVLTMASTQVAHNNSVVFL